MDFTYELDAYEKGYVSVCGVDEAGRGPLAGSVFAAAVILPKDVEITGINDSKKLSEKKRELLFDIIKEKAISYHIASIDAKEIDEINILQATFKAMSIAAQKVEADFALIDGNKVPPMLHIPAEAIVKGDAKSASIAAASILAKVSRDREMIELDKIYPEYNFKKHKGYGTKAHVEALLTHGPCEIHRLTFLKKILK